ncbi:unnamed protein product [Lactuca saligna]|uniref:Uncharacterized protein n=1 Tax=Lactuca saligna TaxID=75948 RepID=A0AA36A189_LACSI|nr:unnamed protein product [Lactuca saligna]
MDAIMKGLGYSVPPIICYHVRVPKGDMHFGLRPLGNDDDVLSLAQIVGNTDDVANDIDQRFNEFDEETNDFVLGLYQKFLQSNEQNVDDEVHKGEDNAVNKEVNE